LHFNLLESIGYWFKQMKMQKPNNQVNEFVLQTVTSIILYLVRIELPTCNKK